MEITVTDSFLLNLPEKVDELMESSSLKDAGCMKFFIDESCGSGTSLEDLICKFGNVLGASLKKIHPITVPNAKDIYGHLSIASGYLSREVVAHFEKEMISPASYTIASENCCMTALRESGVDGLLKHYFDCELPLHSKLPPQYKSNQNLQKLKRSAAAKKRQLSKIKNELSPLTAQEQGEKLQKILESDTMKGKEQKLVDYCPCPQCVYTDEIYAVKLSDEQELGDQEVHFDVDAVATANYYNKGFLYANGINVQSQDRNLITSNFSLSYLNMISITSLLDGYFPGINSPYVYAGGIHSFFPLHIEDLSLFSVNYLHYGYPKLWIVILPSAVAKLTFTILKEFNHAGLCLGILSHKYHLVTPTWLKKHGIPFNVVIQRAGQGVILTPNAAHLGFNLGPNMAEAANFGTKSWIPYGIVYPSCTCLPGQVHADLGPIVQSYCPDMLSDYRQRKVPRVPNDQEFHKCVVHPEFKEAIVKSAADDEADGEDSGPISEISVEVRAVNQEQIESMFNVEADEEVSDLIPGMSVNVRQMKKRCKRKLLVCPLCDKHYEGGHKMRLLNHIQEGHSNVTAEERERAELVFKGMFPERNKIPKVICETCGIRVAGLSSLKRHQAKRGCLQE